MIKQPVVRTAVSQNRKVAALVMTSGTAGGILRADNVPTVFVTPASLLKLSECNMCWPLSCLADPMRALVSG